jgi:hypothetical protein
MLNCADIEILLCDYVDGTLHTAQKSALEEHLAGCAACRELAADASGAVEFISRAADVEPPPELMTRLMFQLPSVKQELKPNWVRRTFGSWLAPIVQPRVAMSMAMTVLSFGMLSTCAGVPPRQLKPSDLNPVNVALTVEDRFSRSWARAVKYYDSLRFVYEMQSQIKEWREQAAQREEAPPSQTQESKPSQPRDEAKPKQP